MTAPTLAIDFGTSNSAAAIWRNGHIERLQIEPGAETLPTAVFFPAKGGTMQVGTKAMQAMVEGEEGRYMRALKSVLGTTLFHESRLIGGKRRTLSDVVTDFLIALKSRAEAQSGERFTRALSGRPVRFHSADAARDAQAEADLRACYKAAGFTEIAFLPEPEAAAHACRALSPDGELGLIVDIGGGTSDFTVFESAPSGIRILTSYGIRLGGTDFDHAISMDHAMPLLGLGGQLKRTLGEGLLPVPRSLYVDLSTWAMIPFLYSRDTERLVEDMVKHAQDPVAMKRLETVITDQLGHELAFAVEHGKIEANADQPNACIQMGYIQRGLAAKLSQGALNASLAPNRSTLQQAIYQTLMQANVAPQDIGTIILVGGSSLLSFVGQEAQSLCTKARLHRSEVFTAVVDGLAVASAL